jgi:16S rRNA processing protein RimM
MSSIPPNLDTTKLVSVGTVRDAFGLKGEIFIALRSGSATPWLATKNSKPSTKVPDAIVLQSPDGKVQTFEILSHRPHKNGVVLRLKGVNDRTQAEGLKKWLYMLESETLTAASGEQPFLAEVMGLTVERVGGEVLGVVENVLKAPRWDVLVVRGPKGVVDVPFLETWVVSMDLKAGKIVMDLQDEFLDPDFWTASK